MPVYVIDRKNKGIQFISAKGAGDAFSQAVSEYRTGFTVREPSRLERAVFRQKIKEISRDSENTPGK